MAARSRLFAVRQGFVLPPELVARSSPPEMARTTDVVFDTSDYRLTRRGTTVWRTTARGMASRWSLQVPLERPERHSAVDVVERAWASESLTPPDALVAAVRAITANHPLVEVARVRRERHTTALTVDGSGRGAVHHDYLALLDGRRIVARAWRLQVDVDHADIDGELDAIATYLRAAGAEDAPVPSTMAALIGGNSLAPPTPAACSVDAQSTCAVTVAAALSNDAHDVLHHLPLLHLAPDVEVVHQARVAVRRFRSNLRTFGPVLDDAERRSLSQRLRVLGDALGSVRDLDVLVIVLARLRDRLPERDHEDAARLIALFANERPAALADVLDLIARDEVVAAVEAMVLFAADPPIVARADEPARIVLTALARRSWRRVRGAAERLDEHSPIAELHQLRILVKRARYAASAAALVRPEAALHANALAHLQGTLGEINDATITEERLRAAVASGIDGKVAYAAGVMVGASRRRVQRHRALWPTKWEETRRKKVRRWLESSG